MIKQIRRSHSLHFQIIVASSHSQSTESATLQASSISPNITLTSTSSSSSMSSSTTRHKFIPSATPNPKVKKRGSTHTTTDSSKVKKNAHAGNVQNVNSSREALSQEGSDQQVRQLKSISMSSKIVCPRVAMTVALKIISSRTSVGFRPACHKKVIRKCCSIRQNSACTLRVT